MSKTKCPACGALSIRQGAIKCPSCRAWVRFPALAKSRARLGALGLVVLAAGLGGFGMLAGGAAVLSAQGRLGGHPPSPLPSARAPSPPGSEPQTAPPRDPEPEAPPSKEEASTPEAFAIAASSTVRLDVPLADVLVSADDAYLFVLCEDGTLRVHAADTGAEKRRVRLPGRGKSLRRLAAGRMAVLGLPATLPIVDTAAWLSGAQDTAFLTKLDVRSAVDVVTLGDPAVLVAASAVGNRVFKFGGKNYNNGEGEITFPNPVRGLTVLRMGAAGESAGALERLVILLDGRLPMQLGEVVVLDPAGRPLGGARAVWSSFLEPRATGSLGQGRALLFDRATAQVVGFSLEGPSTAAPAGPQPIAAFAWAGERAVGIGAGGEGTLSSLAGQEVVSTVALGGIPSSAVATPDGQMILVALGGGVRGRGATTVALGGEPLRVLSTFATGEGSHVVSVGGAGRVAAVGATWARTVTVLRRP